MSKSPLIHHGDTHSADHSEASFADLDGKLVIARHKDKGLCISRFRRYTGVEDLRAGAVSPDVREGLWLPHDYQ